MLNVRIHDRGPRVVALQVLLNQHGDTSDRLKVDGVFGPKTASALANLRRELMRQSSGMSVNHADPAVWKYLMGRSRLQTVDAVDVTDVTYLKVVMPWLERHGDPLTLGGMSNGLVQVINDVVSRASGSNVMLVRFHGHGGPGLQAIAHGTRKLAGTMDYNEELTVLNATTLGKLRSPLSKLASVMCSFGFVELHGCRVGKGSKGQALLRSLSDVWRVPVSAGIPYAKSGYDPKTTGPGVTFDLEGPIETAYPGGGTLATWGARVGLA